MARATDTGTDRDRHRGDPVVRSPRQSHVPHHGQQGQREQARQRGQRRVTRAVALRAWSAADAESTGPQDGCAADRNQRREDPQILVVQPREPGEAGASRERTPTTRCAAQERIGSAREGERGEVGEQVRGVEENRPAQHRGRGPLRRSRLATHVGDQPEQDPSERPEPETRPGPDDEGERVGNDVPRARAYQGTSSADNP